MEMSAFGPVQKSGGPKADSTIGELHFMKFTHLSLKTHTLLTFEVYSIDMSNKTMLKKSGNRSMEAGNSEIPSQLMRGGFIFLFRSQPCPETN